MVAMSVSKAIEILQGLSPSLVALPGTPEYETISGRYLSKFQSDLKPAAFATPANTDEVVSIVKALSAFGTEVPLAVSGAGQQPAPGVGNVAGGITIHLGRFKGVELNSDKTVVSISPGETWGSVYGRLDAEGLSVSGCRASTGGIGGIATHGKLSPTLPIPSHVRLLTLPFKVVSHSFPPSVASS
jgi:FAD/FMN-containing dehydrogenase